MTETPQQARLQDSPPATLIACLLILAAACALSGLVAAVWVLSSAGWGGVGGATLLAGGAYFFAGSFPAAVLWALAWIVRRMHNSAPAGSVMFRSPGDFVQPGEAPARAEAKPESPGDAELLQRVVAELSEMNSNLLLTDQQREAKRRRLQAESSEKLVERIHDAIEAREFAEAERLLERLIAEVPDEPRHAGLVASLEEARADAYAQDVQEATRRAEDLMSVADFSPARQAAEQLLAKHPASVEAIALLDRVKREEGAFVAEQRKRFYGEIERHVNAHKWRPAVEAATKFLRAYPGSPEAELVRAQMPTLEENARIEEVRRMRDEIREMLARRRYAEALELARRVVEQFPDTAAAAELREQLSRLKELADEKEGSA